MCFNSTFDSNLQKEPIPLIAKKDIVCYKKMSVFKKDKGVRLRSSIFCDIEKNNHVTKVCYELGKKYHAKDVNGKKAQLKPRTVDKYFSVSEGFHSYNKLKKPGGYRTTNIKCTIPKGTKYFKNETEYVSEEIIFNSICKSTPVYSSSSLEHLAMKNSGALIVKSIKNKFKWSYHPKFWKF